MLFYQIFTGLVTVITSSINPYAVSEFFINVLSADMLFFWEEYFVCGRMTIDSENHLIKDR